jgi:hypothetical protein
MNPTSKKFISLFLAFSLMMLSVNLYAKERRGAKLIVTKKHGYETEGELITVKPNSLLLLSITGRDMSVDIADIRDIRIVKKSKLLTGAWVGIAVGGGTGVLIGRSFRVWDRMSMSQAASGWFWGIFGAIVGLLVGGTIGAVVGIDEKIHIENMTDSEIRGAMYKLSRKARIRDYK